MTVAAIHPYRLSVKDWGSQAKLDLTRPTAYLNWYDQALDYLGPPSRPDVRALLKWAETQTVPIDAGREVIAVQELGAQGVHLAEGAAGVGFVSETILAGLRTIIHDNLLGRARAAGRGLELWRKLRSEARGSAPALAAVKAQQWSQPRQSASVAALWTDLDDWLLLGQEVEEGSLHSMVRPPWLKLQSLKMLLPSSLETQLKLQLPEANFDEALAWVRRQMEFQRGDSQAQSFAKNADKGLNEVRTELEAAKAREDELMWYLYEADAATIDAVRKGKGGKGGRKGKGGKQQSQQRPPGKGGQGGKGIKGKCWNCGEQGHMAANCPQGGKGGRPLNELTSEEAAAAAGTAAAAATEEAAAAASWFGDGSSWNLLGSLSAPPGLENSLCSSDGDRRDVAPFVGASLASDRSTAMPQQSQQQPKQPQKYMKEGPPVWQPSLRHFGDRAPQQLHGTPAVLQGMGQWPLPCPVAAIHPHPPNANEAPARTRRQRKWKLLQGVWENKSEERQEEIKEEKPDDDRSSSATLCGVTAPVAIPAGMKVVKVDATVDSGAEAVVAPKGIIPGTLATSAMSRSGKVYRAANGSRIANFGQTEAAFRTGEGHNCKLLFQVADVERVLIGVTPLTESGHEVRLGKHGGEILHVDSGKRIALQRRGGVYHLSMFFLVPDGMSSAAPAQDFTRQGA